MVIFEFILYQIALIFVIRYYYRKYKGKKDWASVYQEGMFVIGFGLINFFLIFCLIEKCSITMVIRNLMVHRFSEFNLQTPNTSFLSKKNNNLFANF